ncbi:MAG: glycosyltransferase family 1 protein [Hyphomicrobiaceae bacterium]
MKILVATDAWRPQVNGVVRTYERLREEAPRFGAEIDFLTPAEFHSIPAPTYPEIRLSIPGFRYVRRRFAEASPDAVHIATEGPVGWMARSYCLKRRIPFTTSFHTRFPEYLEPRFGVPQSWTYGLLRAFHNAGAGVMVATGSLAQELSARGFERILPWTRGVDTELFAPRRVRRFGDGPVFITVGRVAVEKNLSAFLDLDLPGRKVVVGDGPQLAELRARYPDAVFTGRQTGEDLAQCYASGDVFVMPSRTETFGIVQLEAMASGLPVAAFPVTGPVDVVTPGVTGELSNDLAAAARRALALDRSVVRARALDYSWENATRLFLGNIETAQFASLGRRLPSRRARVASRPASA